VHLPWVGGNHLLHLGSGLVYFTLYEVNFLFGGKYIIIRACNFFQFIISRNSIIIFFLDEVSTGYIKVIIGFGIYFYQLIKGIFQFWGVVIFFITLRQRYPVPFIIGTNCGCLFQQYLRVIIIAFKFFKISQFVQGRRVCRVGT